MIRRILEVLLLVLLALGIYQAWTTGAERSRLQSEYERLVAATGQLPIGDPTKVHIRAVPTGEPLNFAWRVYLPAGYKWISRSSIQTAGSTFSAVPQQAIIRVRFGVEDGHFKVYEKTLGGSWRHIIGDQALAKFLEERKDRILVDQFGSKQIETIEPDGSFSLLRLLLTDEMMADANQSLKLENYNLSTGDLFWLEVGPNQPPSTGFSRPPGN